MALLESLETDTNEVLSIGRVCTTVLGRTVLLELEY